MYKKKGMISNKIKIYRDNSASSASVGKFYQGKYFLVSYKKYVNQNPSQCAFVNISQMGKRADITICKECPNLIFLRMYAQTFPSSYKCGGFSCSVSFGHSSRLQLNTRV